MTAGTVIDVRFEITRNDEPDCPGTLYFVRIIERVEVPPDETWPVATVIDGAVIESFTCDDPYGVVDAYRYRQAVPMEDDLEPFGPAWEREMYAERAGF